MARRLNQPVKEYRVGTVKTAIWCRDVERNGRTVTQHSIKLQRSYRDPATGEWRNEEMTLFPNHIPAFSLVLDATQRYCRLSESGDGAESSASET